MSLDVRADTACSRLSLVPTFGLGTMLHAVPSHRSMRVWETPLVFE
jgi:hypothetical protein